jgi:hypothetical protein
MPPSAKLLENSSKASHDVDPSGLWAAVQVVAGLAVSVRAVPAVVVPAALLARAVLVPKDRVPA